jgi:hypothetical protein
MDIQEILEKDLFLNGRQQRFEELVQKLYAGATALIRLEQKRSDIMSVITILVEADIALLQAMYMFQAIILPPVSDLLRADVALSECAAEVSKYLVGSATLRSALQKVVDANQALQHVIPAFPPHLYNATKEKLINDIERSISQEAYHGSITATAKIR